MMSSPSQPPERTRKFPPAETISETLNMLVARREVMKNMPYPADQDRQQEYEQEFAAGITEIVVGAIQERPACASDTFKVSRDESNSLSQEKPLMHWVCHLDCPLPLVETIFNTAGPDSVRTRTSPSKHDPQALGTLPLHEACMNGASVELIRYLLNLYPEAAGLLYRDLLPLEWALCSIPRGSMMNTSDPHNPSSRETTLFRLLSESLDPDVLRRSTRTLTIAWEPPSEIPRAVIDIVAKLHKCKALVVRGNIGRGTGLETEVDGDELICNLECYRHFDFAVEQLLMLPIPLKAIETSTLDEPQAIRFLINTLEPAQPEIDDMTDVLAQLGLLDLPVMNSPHVLLQPPPLDLTSVERICIDSFVNDTETMVSLIESLHCVPNLKKLSLCGRQNRYEGHDYPFDDNCFHELSEVINGSNNLRDIDLNYFEQSAALSFADFLKASGNKLERVSFTSFDVLEASQVKRIAQALHSNTSVKWLRLAPLKDGTKYILDAIKDINESTLEEFIGEGHRCPSTGNKMNFEHSNDIQTCLVINKAARQLQENSVTDNEAYRLYCLHKQETPVLYALLRYRPELWCKCELK